MAVVKAKKGKMFPRAPLPAISKPRRLREDVYPVQPSDGAKSDVNSYRILVVDDDPIVLELVAKMVKRLGHHPTAAEDAMDALFHLAAADYHLVITDYKMPFMDGYQLAVRIKTHHCGTRVVVMTGYCEEEVAHRLNGSGPFDGLLLKPFNMKTLKARINAFKGWHANPIALEN